MEPCVKMISSPKEQTPTDLMLTPNWPDQNAGSGRCGQRSASRLTMLCAATAAPRTALSQCSSVRNWYPYSTWGKRAMSPTNPVDVEGSTARVAADAPEAGRQPRPLQPLGVADRTE